MFATGFATVGGSVFGDVLQASTYATMKWRDLHALVKTRGLTSMLPSSGWTKTALQNVLEAADAEQGHHGAKPTDGAGAGAGSGQGNALAELLNPRKKSEHWLSKAESGKSGQDITGMFLDVDRSGPLPGKASIDFEDASMDGILPSVTVDKFLQAGHVLGTSEHLGVLLGHEHKFGKGAQRFKRHVVTNMVCGWFSQVYSLEPCWHL